MSSLQGLLKSRLGPSSLVFRWLWSTCVHTDYRTFRRDPERPVIECEEFDDHVEMAFARPVPVNVRLGDERMEPGQKASAYWGLCSTCEHADYCTFPRPTGGVWFCEEYR